MFATDVTSTLRSLQLRAGVMPAMANATSCFYAIHNNILHKCRKEASSVLNYATAILFQGLNSTV